MIELHTDWDGAKPSAPGRADRVLVLLHGFTGDLTTWEPVRSGLRRWGRTLGVDLIGHGRSPVPQQVADYSMSACLDQVLRVLDTLGIANAWWLGYSMGGRVALQMAAHHPHRVQGLLLVSTMAGYADPAERSRRIAEDQALAQSIEAGGVPAFVEHWLERPIFSGFKRLPPPQQAALREQRLRNSALGLANSLRGMGAGAMPPVWEQLAPLRVPVLVMAGEEDPKFVDQAARLGALWPHAQRKIFSGAGHAPQVTHPQAFLAEIDQFFAMLE